jgi:Relaxase/Mobilisation nuclease domain
MPKARTDIGCARPFLDIASYARHGAGQKDRLSHEEIALIARTVRRTPEVMVKVLSRGWQDMKAVRRHFSYLSRNGDLTIETDDGQELRGREAEADLLKDWDLDIQEQRPTSSLGPGLTRKAPKLVHKVLFSMPPGTPPNKVLEAVRVLAREEFGLRHRYAMVLHTDEPHPHVHVVLKAVNEKGDRLNIRKTMLRDWRSAFARHLRALSVPANATDRSVRGQPRSPKHDSIFWSEQRGESRRAGARAEAVAAELLNGGLRVEAGKATMLQTRRSVQRGWRAVSDILMAEGQSELAAQVRRFSAQMPPPLTDNDSIAEDLRRYKREGLALQGYRTR